MSTFEEYVFVKNTRWIFFGGVALLLALLIFLAGVNVGRRSELRPGARGFHLPFAPAGVDLPPGFIPHGHGAVGVITALSPTAATLQESDGETEQITLASITLVEGPQGTTSLMQGEHVIVLGTPEVGADGDDIQAKLIRITP